MTILKRVTGDSFPASLADPRIPFQTNCLGLSLFGVSDAASRINHVPGGAPLVPYGSGGGPVAFRPNSARFKAAGKGYQTPFSVTPRNYTVVMVGQLKYFIAGSQPDQSDAYIDSFGNTSSYDFSPFGDPTGQLRFLIPGPLVRGLNGDTVSFPQGFPTKLTTEQQFIAFVERPDGLDIYCEDGGAGCGLQSGSAQIATALTAGPQPLIYGATPSSGHSPADYSLAMVWNRPLTQLEIYAVYLWTLRMNVARGIVPWLAL